MENITRIHGEVSDYIRASVLEIRAVFSRAKINYSLLGQDLIV